MCVCVCVFYCECSDLGFFLAGDGGGADESGRRKPRERRRAEPALVGRARARPVLADRQHQQDHEEGVAGQRQDRQGRQGYDAGMRLRVHQLHHQRVRTKFCFYYTVLLLNLNLRNCLRLVFAYGKALFYEM